MKRVVTAAIVLMLSLTARSHGGDAAFRFNGVDFFQRGNEAGIREFLPAGETFERWSQLVSVRCFGNRRDPRAYALKLFASAEASNPAAKGQVLKSDQSDVYVADFLLFSPAGKQPEFAEWNLWRIARKDGGLEAVQYARRFYDFSDDSVVEIKAARNRLVPALADLVIGPCTARE